MNLNYWCIRSFKRPTFDAFLLILLVFRIDFLNEAETTVNYDTTLL